MADEFDVEAGKGSPRDANPAALDVAAAHAGSEEAREFLHRQSRLTELQEEILREEHALEMSHFKWRRFNDQMKGALQILTVLVGVAVVVAVVVIMWRASQADGLVVDTFSVAPRFAEAGMTGDVIADDLTNRIAAVRDTANANSIAHSKDVKSERDEAIRVEIPDAGVSLAEIWRSLRGWLGHERHLHGNLRTTADGGLALTMALDGANAATFTGRDLDKVEQQAAEHVFQGVDPSNYILYLYSQNRDDDSLAAIKHLIAVSDGPSMLSDGYALWGNWARHITGDAAFDIARERFAAAVDPRALPPHMEMMITDADIGHDEDALREARKIPNFRQDEQYAWREGNGFSHVVAAGALAEETLTGDFSAAQSQPCGLCDDAIEERLGRAEYAARAHDVMRGRAMIAEALYSGTANGADIARGRYFVDSESGDWQKAVEDARLYAAAIEYKSERLRAVLVRVNALPLLAEALAHVGRFEAHTEIDKTPGDCVACETARGDIDATEKNEGGAQFWYARAVHDAPSIPFAYTDWGAMLLARGQYGAAIAKFKAAHDRGPHFADPLEMWGEALMQENRSDLALAKFQEANQYAPNWGRLHLKWGEALFYAGKRDEAKKQLSIAAGLDLSSDERPALARFTR